MPKTYGPDTVPEIPRVPFSLRAVHEDPMTGERELRTHDFIAKPNPSSGDFYRFAKGAEDEGSGLLLVLADILPRLIANDDGVPAQWSYQPLPAKQVAVTRPGEGVLITGTEDDEQINFRGPDGQIYPASERGRFEAFDAGSSRRRLHALLFTDETVKVEMATVAEIMKDLFTAAGKGPGSA